MNDLTLNIEFDKQEVQDRQDEFDERMKGFKDLDMIIEYAHVDNHYRIIFKDLYSCFWFGTQMWEFI